MFEYRFSKIERVWLMGIRLVWAHHGGEAVIALVDRLYMEAGITPCGAKLRERRAARSCAPAQGLAARWRRSSLHRAL